MLLDVSWLIPASTWSVSRSVSPVSWGHQPQEAHVLGTTSPQHNTPSRVWELSTAFYACIPPDKLEVASVELVGIRVKATVSWGHKPWGVTSNPVFSNRFYVCSKLHARFES